MCSVFITLCAVIQPNLCIRHEGFARCAKTHADVETGPLATQNQILKLFKILVLFEFAQRTSTESWF